MIPLRKANRAKLTSALLLYFAALSQSKRCGPRVGHFYRQYYCLRKTSCAHTTEVQVPRRTIVLAGSTRCGARGPAALTLYDRSHHATGPRNSDSNLQSQGPPEIFLIQGLYKSSSASSTFFLSQAQHHILQCTPHDSLDRYWEMRIWRGIRVTFGTLFEGCVADSASGTGLSLVR